jgi:hypothetical protein
MVRYSDDFVVLAESETRLCEPHAAIMTVLKRRGLALNVVKTRMVAPGLQFSFLGQGLSARVLPGTRHAVR